MESINLMDVDCLVQLFFKEREQGINTLHQIYFKNNQQLSLRSFKEELTNELRTGCVSFINKGSPLEELHNYLFYISNAFCKKISKPIVKQKIEYICPGCLFLGKEYSILPDDAIFKCDECNFELQKTSDPKKLHFFTTFFIHNKSGYRCADCQRFIPHPINNIITAVSCPYFDCLFSGNLGKLHKMHHPHSKSNPEKLILDVSQPNGGSLKDSILSQEPDIQLQLELAEDLKNKVATLREIIETQSNSVLYNSSDATVKHKQYVYQAFSNLLKEFPEEMVNYLFNNNAHHMGFQHKIFQEYIKILESSLPFFITKNRKLYKIDNLLDNNLCLFDGISVFDTKVTNTFIIKNETKEFYIGGRKATYTKPFYIGKLLNVIQSETKESLMNLVKDYSFSRIRIQDIKPGTPVTVTHLRVPPHYQMGGMVYVNRIRKKIADRAQATI